MTEGINVGSVYADVLPDARQFNTRLAEIARNAAVTVKIDADTRAAKAKIDALTGGDVKARVDVDDTAAKTKLDVLTRNRETKVTAKADTGDAAAKLDRLGQSGNGASGGLSGLWQVALALSPALVPVGAAAIGVGAALGTMAAAGAAGVGVLGIALASVTGAVKLLGQQQTAQAAASVSAGQQAAAHAQAIVSADRQIQSAEMSLGDARRQAANSAIQSAQQVASAQYGLIQADQQEKDALQALQAAREAATRQLQSMANAAVDARLAERQAVLDLETATANYAKVTQNAGSTDQQRQQAALDVAKAQQHLTEAHQAAANAQVDNTKAQKLGVDGAPQVVSAAQAVANAQHAQQQAVQNLADAQRAAAQQQIQSAESIQRAEQGVAAAMDAMAAAQRNSAGSTSASLAAVNAQVAALDPTVRSFAEYLRGTWTPIWRQVQSASSGGLLPGLRAGMDSVRPLMPAFIAFIRDLSNRLGDMARNVGQAFASPFWQSFFAFLTRTMGPALSGLGTILGNIATGFAGIWMAFEPVIMPITKGIENLTQRFADFGKQAAGSAGFGKFLDFMRETGPVVMKILGDLWQVLVHVVQALAPLAGPMLAGLSFLVDLLKKIPVPVLTAAAVAIGAIFVGMRLVQGISAVAALGPWGLAALAVAGAFILVYTNSKTFRDFIANQVVPTLKEWGRWLLDHVVPALSALWDWITHKLVPVLAGIFMDAWNGIVDAVHTVGRALSGHRKELGQVGDALAAVANFIVKYVAPVIGVILKAAFVLIGNEIALVITIISKMVDAWNWLWGVGKGIGHWFANDFVGFFETSWSKISSGWRDLVKEIGGLWQNLKHYLMDPVAFVVRYVINDGLIKAWDWVVTHLHLPGSWAAAPMQVPAVPPLAARMAHGGVLPGYAPGQDTVHVLASPGEGWLVPEAARALGGEAGINAINSHFSSRVPGPGLKGGRQAFEGGGVVSSLLGFFGDLMPGVAAAKSTSTQLNTLLSDPINALTGLVKSLMGGLSSTAPMFGMLMDTVGSLAKGAGQSILDNLLKTLTTGSVDAVIPASRADNVAAVQTAAARYGWQSGAEWQALVNLLMRESGFNNVAQNPTSTAYGMFQFLDSTWAGFGIPKTSDNWLQAQAGTAYIAERYGDPIGAWSHEMSAGWYDNGGILPRGLSLTYNGTSGDEHHAVFTDRQWDSLKALASGATGGSVAPERPTFHVDTMVVPDKQHPAETAEQLAFWARTR